MPSMKKKLFLMLSLTVFPGYMMHGMEKNYCLRAPQPSADNTLRYGECPINKDRVSATLYSAWNCPSQTPDVLIVAICTNNESISLDRHHDTYKWRSLCEPHGTEFTEIGRRKALKYLVKHNIINT